MPDQHAHTCAGKPITFKRELLNTCQDEFEGMEEQRSALSTGAADKYAAERARHALKMRQLGTVNLLSELFNKDLVTHPIMRIVVQELLGTSLKEGVFDSDLIECIVQARSPGGFVVPISQVGCFLAHLMDCFRACRPGA